MIAVWRTVYIEIKAGSVIGAGFSFIVSGC